MDEDHCLDAEMMDHLELAWTILANVDHGDWFRQAEDWREAAIKWRGGYHDILSRFLKTQEERRG